jgi:O-antigen/teichoic acid export membrane protein
LPFFLIAGIFGPAIIRFVFGDNWVTSGKYMQVLLPWLFLVFISSPVSFLPDMLGQQKMAMWLDMFKLLARIMALGVGVYLNKLYLALALFSLISAGFTGFSLYWYLKLAETADQKKIREHLIGSEEPAAGEEKIEFRV